MLMPLVSIALLASLLTLAVVIHAVSCLAILKELDSSQDLIRDGIRMKLWHSTYFLHSCHTLHSTSPPSQIYKRWPFGFQKGGANLQPRSKPYVPMSEDVLVLYQFLG